MTRFELPPPELVTPGPVGLKPWQGALGGEVLLRNVVWFTRLRWIVVAVLLGFECLAIVAGELFRGYGMAIPSRWPWVLAAILCLGNVGFVFHARSLRSLPEPNAPARVNLWTQIVFDLLVLTAVVYFVGSVETYICFTYLFHCILACIFFPPRASLCATILAACLYVGCVVLESTAVLPPSGVFIPAGGPGRARPLTFQTGVQVGSAVTVWLVAWYLTSHLSALVWAQDRELRVTNRRLVRTAREKIDHMLHTTHELKAPFAAIQTNTQVLLKGYCGELPPEALAVIERIEVRSRKLSNQILEMLQLAHLRSPEAQNLAHVEADLAELLRQTIRSAQPSAESREVSFKYDFEPTTVRGVPDQLEILFGNILANAVAYSYPNGIVTVECGCDETGRAVAAVADTGLGIREDCLPHIFDEYFRSKEAAQHNKMSTGLGLTIVRHIAQAHDLGICVETELGKGTRFTVTFPLRA